MLIRGDRVAYLSLLCLIHRNVPPTDGSRGAFSDKCISLAREALEENQTCIIALSHFESRLLELYYNWSVSQLPTRN